MHVDRRQAWDNTVLLCQLRRQQQLPQQDRALHAQAHLLHMFDCTLSRMQDETTQSIAELERQARGLLADKDPPHVQQARQERLAVCKRRARVLHVMIQLLLCNGAPTSGFSIKAMQYARVRIAQLRLEVPPMQWDVCLPPMPRDIM